MEEEEESLGGPECVKAVAVGMGVVGGEGGEEHKARTHAKQPRGAAGEGSATLKASTVGSSLPSRVGGVDCGEWRWRGMWQCWLCVCAWRRKGGRACVMRRAKRHRSYLILVGLHRKGFFYVQHQMSGHAALFLRP